ncbi:BlaI/MecI/CopY family transcriptional regulator [Chitinophaga rhizophila]|uniref:BlaI/MecI/CopY family transcriptional regulator n=1 Tax=Chitinophaga rhizophila TaxID=2866212 RepID=A0ABS7GCD4_9BACT|nr:BlaI/MecI/CopY family transcriptional regulator [Chitinophaga rhizophila]MBW8685086.1 BlaI/MecI/CopY family transcriptional regulator [Chitinophaga rhizophila]
MTTVKTLTKAEEQVMQALWKTGPAFVKDMIDLMPEPKPHYNTVSTLIKILQEKGFVDYKAFGKSYQYYALISKEEYSRNTMQHFVKGYFSGSFRDMVSFFVKEKDLSVNELEQLLEQIKDAKKDQP